MRFYERIGVPEDVVFLTETGEVAEGLADRDGVSVQVAVSNLGNAVVDIQVANDPIVVLKFFDVVETCCKEEPEPPPTLNVLLDENTAVRAAVCRLQHIIAYLEVATQFLALRVLRCKGIFGLQLILQVVVDL